MASLTAVSFYGALTTQFTPPATCLHNIYGGGTSADFKDFGGNLGSESIYGMVHGECVPPNFNPDHIFPPIGWYSPGVCPSGWTAARAWTTSDTDLMAMYYEAIHITVSEVPDETTVWCCPRSVPVIPLPGEKTYLTDFPANAATEVSGLSMPPRVYIACEGVTSSVVVTTCVSTTLTYTVNPTLGTVEFWTCPVTGTTFYPDSLALTANPVFVKYRPTDIPLLQKAVPTWGSFLGLTIPPTTTAQPASTATGGASSTGTSSSSNSTSGLSQDAKIAIGVAVPVVVIAFLLGGFLAIRWHRARWSESDSAPPAESGLEQNSKPELDGQGKPPSAAEHGELESAECTGRTELDTERPPRLGTPGWPAEMGYYPQHARAAELAS